MASRQCPECLTRWPAGSEYSECPGCEKRTTYFGGMTPRYVGREAAQKANELRFERFYIEREKERERRGDPSPETLGAIEARRQLAETRALEKILDADLQAEPPVTSDVELRVS